MDKGEPSKSPQQNPEPLNKRRSSIFSRTFPGLPASRRTSEGSEDLRGALGLNLLSNADEPVVDFVFVHGLGGGSRKTWSKEKDIASFWPSTWLSRDPEFKCVRIHSFGYDSDWMGRREKVLDVSDFGKSLLVALQGSILIRRSLNLPLIFVAHSMGGLVVKQAFLIAQHDPAFRDLASRFHTIFFLATPHHGASSAELLSTILNISYAGNAPFVGDLHYNSPAIQAINDEFRHHADKIQFYSFFETRPTSIFSIRNKIIVTKSSAIMGYPRERVAYLDADHRGICKFESQSDPNFMTLRGSFVETLDCIKGQSHAPTREEERVQRQRLKKFLCISDQLEDNHIDLEESRMEGSCEWLSQLPQFCDWQGSASEDSASIKVFWLNGNPATGKTFLAQYVVDHLNNFNCDCSFYYFRESEIRATIGRCLQSLAYQMALSNKSIRETFFEMDDEVSFNGDNYQSLWRKLFVGGILQICSRRPHYWVLDALDESNNPEALFPLIAKASCEFPLRIFVTSRPSVQLENQLKRMDTPPIIHRILPEHTLDDIKRLVESKADFLSAEEEETRQELISTILGKADGCFLWVSLVFKALRDVHTTSTTQRILEDVPLGMDRLYTKILQNVSSATYTKPLIKAILMWTVCSIRPLTTAELKEALKIGINDTVYNLAEQVAPLCGHLVYVDTQSRIRAVHQTARTFLLSSNSEFAFEEKEGHQKLAKTCLSYLLSDEMKAPRSRRPGFSQKPPRRSPFLDYAAKSFYEHINKASSSDGEIRKIYSSFLSSSGVQSWIEHIAKGGDLNPLIRAGMVGRTYVARSTKHFPKMGSDIETINSWSTDLIHIVAKFGGNLLKSPSSIYHTIPAFCPREAAPYKQFGRSARGLTVVGLSSAFWDDCLACIDNQENPPSAVACSSSHFATGSINKVVRLYYAATCQLFGKLEHGEPVKVLEFNASGQLLASAGRRCIQVWDMATKKSRWRFNTPSPCIALIFTSDNKTLMTACHDSQHRVYDLTEGRCSQTDRWYIDFDHSMQIYRQPEVIAFSLEYKLLAAVYRGSPIYLWNWEEGYFVGTCDKPSLKKEILPFHASSIVFNPIPGLNSLAAAYEGGSLYVFEPESGDVKAFYQADTDTQTLACSPDGRTLISGDSIGTIRIFDFEDFPSKELKLLHIIYGRGENIRALAFFVDGRRFMDIRQTQNRVWEPAELTRQVFDEECSTTISSGIVEASQSEIKGIDEITVLLIEPTGKFVFAGTEQGRVIVFMTVDGKRCETLYEHSSGVSITNLSFNERRGIISSGDSSGRVLVQRIRLQSQGWELQETLLEHRAEDPLENLIFSPDNTKLLIATTILDVLYSLDGFVVKKLCWTTRNAGLWTKHPHDPSSLLLIIGNLLRIYSWDDLHEITGKDGIRVGGDIVPEYSVRNSYCGWKDQILITEYSDHSHSRSQLQLLLLDFENLDPGQPTVFLHPNISAVSEKLPTLIGTLGTMIGTIDDKIIFLSQDGWICSLSMEQSIPAFYKRHFFLPYDWLSTTNSLLFGVTIANEIVMGKLDELIIIKKGLEYFEELPF